MNRIAGAVDYGYDYEASSMERDDCHLQEDPDGARRFDT